MAVPLQLTLTGTATTKLGNDTTELALSSRAAIELSYTQPSTVTITNFPAITYPEIMNNGFTMTTTVAPFDPINIAEAGTFNAADGSIFVPRLTLLITIDVSGSFSTASGSFPVNMTQSGALLTDLTTGSASSDAFDSGTVFNDQGSPLQPSGQVTLVGDGHFWDDDGNVTTFAGMTGGAIVLAGTISYPPNTVAVPDVVGDDVPTARRAMASANLYFEPQRGSPDPMLAVPTVAEQTPVANALVQTGTQVTCRVDYPDPSRN
jgi:hypothetical protein